MDLTKVQDTTNPVNEAAHSPDKRTTIKGAEIVSYKNLKGPLIDTMSDAQLNASSMNADLRKKLRVDRVRKNTISSSAMVTSIEDMN